MKSARQVAYEALYKIMKEGAYSNLILDGLFKDNPQLDDRDRAFVSNLVYGTLDNMILLDFNLDIYLNQPSSKLKPELHTIMLLGAYQILFMDKVPDSAAVNESVELAKKNKSKFAASLVNAVLRRVSENGLKAPDESDLSISALSVRYSCPEWILQLWADSYDIINAAALANEALKAPDVTIRVNTTVIKPDELIWRLAEEGVVSHLSDKCENALVVENCPGIENLEAYKQGLFHTQDIASQLCVKVLNAKKDETVIDLCSAPGGKTFSIAEDMQNTGTVKAFDVYQSRVNLVFQGAKRLGLNNVFASLADSSEYNANIGSADCVLCDVPCSGLGVIRRKPEIKFKSKSSIENLPNLQYKILCVGSKYVKSGGRLIYSTCTLNPAENQLVCQRFLSEHSGFASVPVLPEIEGTRHGDFLTLMPHLNDCDGFFIAAFKKTDS
ncbi:MAG: 16S rRNA (cytosine(967)-C(5))-methyltransferase RsmB [Clostridiales bacterium]|nr:16S rRNA (cytosine(967)-C(5))-methyltransferase RsmB [Clostridiales bacterium]